MQLLLTFITKEFKHILRDRRTLLILFGLPVAQILLFGFALTNEVKNTQVAVLDRSGDEMTRRIIDRLSAGTYFDIDRILYREEEVNTALRTDRATMVIAFPSDFRRTLLHTNSATVQLIVDGSDPNTATTILNYASAIINDVGRELQEEGALPYVITTETRMLYNPQLKGSYNFVPGVIALVLMLVCVLMTSVAIVREKELGTMEILLVSPMRPAVLIVAKMIPYLTLSFLIVGVILAMGVTLLDVPIRGSLPLLLGESLLFILTCLAIGLLISNITRTQQTAMLITLIGMMMPTLVFSGFMFPIENMPLALQLISNVIPSKWFFHIVQGIMIKGLGFEGIWRETLILAGMTLFFTFVSARKFSIRLT